MKQNKNLSIQEQVGDTSLLTSKQNSKGRKITIAASLVGFVILIALSIFLFVTPVKAVFVNQFGKDNSTNERYQISRESGLLIDGPKDPTRICFEFGGWYLNKDFNGDALFNNDNDKSLLEYKFSTSKKTTTLYAKWIATEFTIEYDCKGNANFGETFTNELKDKNAAINPLTYSVKHELSDFEIKAYVDKLRAENPDLYVNAQNAQKNIQDAIEIFNNEAKKAEITLKPLSVNGWTFLGWFDEEGNKVEKLDKTAPTNLKLIARWEQN